MQIKIKFSYFFVRDIIPNGSMKNMLYISFWRVSASSRQLLFITNPVHMVRIRMNNGIYQTMQVLFLTFVFLLCILDACSIQGTEDKLNYWNKALFTCYWLTDDWSNNFHIFEKPFFSIVYIQYHRSNLRLRRWFRKYRQ